MNDLRQTLCLARYPVYNSPSHGGGGGFCIKKILSAEKKIKITYKGTLFMWDLPRIVRKLFKSRNTKPSVYVNDFWACHLQNKFVRETTCSVVIHCCKKQKLRPDALWGKCYGGSGSPSTWYTLYTTVYTSLVGSLSGLFSQCLHLSSLN